MNLLPCPFCGSENIAISRPGPEEEASVMCLNCAAQSGVHNDCLPAIEHWNTRASVWLPIESAPKDTRAILLCGKQWIDKGWWDKQRACWKTVDVTYFADDEPIMWMPMPGLPVKTT